MRVEAEGVKDRLKVENTMKKPQNAWIRTIDNSYNVFVPTLERKTHFFKDGKIIAADGDEGVLNKEILKA